MTQNFETDYSVKNAEKISTKGEKISMYITPRYENHYLNNNYEEYSISIFKNILSNTGCFIDIGAHYGYYSLVAHKQKPDKKIIAIEPVLENFQVLKKNFKLNTINNSKLINKAASNVDGEKKFIITEASDSSGFFGNHTAKKIRDTSVKTINTGVFLNKLNIDFIKIDVEGCEVEILNSFKKNNKKRPNILVEFNPRCQILAGKKPSEMLNVLKSMDYDLFLISDERRQNNIYSNFFCSPYGIHKITNNISKAEIISTTYSNILCVPKNIYKLVTFFSHSSQLGGGEKSMIELIEELKDKQIFSHVVIPEKGPIQEELEKNYIPYDIVKLDWWAKVRTKNEVKERTYSQTESFKNLTEYLTKLSLINPDLIYTNTMVIPWGAIAANYLDKPHIWHIREFGELDHKLSFKLPYVKIIEYIENNSEKLIFNSKAVLNHFSKYLKKIKTQVAYNYIKIDPKLSDEIVSSPFKNEKSLKILVCGSIQEGKNQIEAVKTITQLIKNKQKAELLLLGNISDQNYFNQINKYIQENKVQNYIHILSFTKNPYPYFKLADIILVTSKKEAYGRTIVEGMLLNKPIIATKEGGTSEIIKNNINGFTYSVGDVNKLEKLIITLKNSGLRNKIAISGYKSLKKINNKKGYGHKIGKIIKDTINNYHSHKKLTKTTLEPLKINIQEIKKENKKINKEIIHLNQTTLKYQNEINNIISSKYYKLWRLYCDIKDRVKK